MNPLLCALVALALLAGLPAQDNPDLEMRAARKQAAAACALKNEEGRDAVAAARKVWEELAAKYATNPAVAGRSRLEAGRLAERLKDRKGAEALYAAAADCPEVKIAADALGELASLHMQAERREAAEKCWTQIIERCAEEQTDCANAMLRLGALAQQRSRATDAEQWYRRVLNEHGALWRPCVDALEELVDLQLGKGDRDGAKKLYDAHALALRSRFAGSGSEKRVDVALTRLAARAQFDGSGKGE